MVTSVGMLAMCVSGGNAGRSSESEADTGAVNGAGVGEVVGAGCGGCA